jgi:hypothetical protein
MLPVQRERRTGKEVPPERARGELKKGKITHVRSRFSLVKAQREVLPRLTDRGLINTRCFRGGLTLGVHNIPFLEFSPGANQSAVCEINGVVLCLVAHGRQ